VGEKRANEHTKSGKIERESTETTKTQLAIRERQNQIRRNKKKKTKEGIDWKLNLKGLEGRRNQRRRTISRRTSIVYHETWGGRSTAKSGDDHIPLEKKLMDVPTRKTAKIDND